jgi:hypothetical protein
MGQPDQGGQGGTQGQSGQNSATGQPGRGTPGNRPGTPGASGGETPSNDGTPSGKPGDQGTAPGPEGQGNPGRGVGRPSGGGGGPTPSETAGNPPSPDESKPSTPAASRELNADETVAPKNIPQSEFTLRKVQELLKDKDAASKLEQDTGMSREEMEQFVQKMQRDRVPKSADRQGQEIQVKPGTNSPAASNPTLPGLDPRTNFSTKTLRDRGAVVQDQVRDNAEDVRLIAPREIRSGFEAYKSTLSRSRTLNPTRTAPAPAGGANAGAGPGSR